MHNQNDSTLRMKNKLAEWDAPMNQMVFLTTTSALSFLLIVTIWRNAGIHLRGNLLLHDLITQILHRSLQRRIVVMGIIDAFVYAHNYHRRCCRPSSWSLECIFSLTSRRRRLLVSVTFASASSTFCCMSYSEVRASSASSS